VALRWRAPGFQDQRSLKLGAVFRGNRNWPIMNQVFRPYLPQKQWGKAGTGFEWAASDVLLESGLCLSPLLVDFAVVAAKHRAGQTAENAVFDDAGDGVQTVV